MVGWEGVFKIKENFIECSARFVSLMWSLFLIEHSYLSDKCMTSSSLCMFINKNSSHNEIGLTALNPTHNWEDLCVRFIEVESSP